MNNGPDSESPLRSSTLEDTPPPPVVFGVQLPTGMALVGWATLAAISVAALALANGSFDRPTALAAATRYTARVSLLVFLLAFQQPAWRSGRYGTFGRWADENCDDLLGALAATHTVHAIAIYALFSLTDRMAGAASYALGGLGYAMVYLLAFIGAPNASGVAIDRIRIFALYYVWLVFMLTASLATQEYPSAAPFAVLLLFGLVNRFR